MIMVVIEGEVPLPYWHQVNRLNPIFFLQSTRIFHNNLGKGGTGRTFTGGVDVLKFFEKQKLSSIDLEAGDEASVSIMIKKCIDKACSPIETVNRLPKFLRGQFKCTENLLLDKLSSFVTTFLSFLYLGRRNGHDLNCLKSEFLFFVS